MPRKRSRPIDSRGHELVWALDQDGEGFWLHAFGPDYHHSVLAISLDNAELLAERLLNAIAMAKQCRAK